jgi:hypothetical protein
VIPGRWQISNRENVNYLNVQEARGTASSLGAGYEVFSRTEFSIGTFPDARIEEEFRYLLLSITGSNELKVFKLNIDLRVTHIF